MSKGGLWLFFFVGVVRFCFIFRVFSWCDFDVCRVDFATEGSQKPSVGLLVSVEFVPLALVAYNGEGLHSFFVENKAVIAVFVSQVVRRYYADVFVS